MNKEPPHGSSLHPRLADYVLQVCIHLGLVFDLTTEAAHWKALFRCGYPVRCILMWPVRRILDHCGQFVSVGTTEVINKE